MWFGPPEVVPRSINKAPIIQTLPTVIGIYLTVDEYPIIMVAIMGNNKTVKRTDENKRRLNKILEMQCEICKALGHPQRIAIVDQLKAEEVSASDLIAGLGLSKANLSKHIALLIHGGIVESRKEGRQIIYRLTDPDIHRACGIMRAILYRRLKEGEKLASAIHTAEASLAKAH
jgi:ArsR family transcriptional regulator, virulence genes transcriptional regulator